MSRIDALLFVAVSLLAASPSLAANGESADDPPGFEKLVPPLMVEGGPLLSPPLSAVPATGASAGLAVLFGRTQRGRTTYELVSGRLLLSGQWSPKKVPRLGVGAQLVALQSTNLHTRLPPAVDEWNNFFDLGPARLWVSFMAVALARGPVELAVTPFFRMMLPTDTARLRDERRLPIRRVLDDRVAYSPYMLFEPGLSLALTVGPASFYTHQAPVLAPVFGEVFHFLWSMHVGAAVNILGKVHLVAELSALLRPTRDFTDEPLTAVAVCPGVRYVHGSLSFELSSRIGVTDDAYDPYGDFSLGFAVAWAH